MKRFLLGGLLLLLAAGCAPNATFVYKPSAPASSGTKLPVKLAVLPFTDDTEDFTKQGSVLSPAKVTWNLAKTGIRDQISALTPELWAKAFADHLVASGTFQSVRFIYDSSELADEDIRVDGTLMKVIASGAWGYWERPNEFIVNFRATRRAENRPDWILKVVRTWTTPETLYYGCGKKVQCMVDRYHDDTNRVMNDIFEEAQTDLIKALEPLSGIRHVDESSPQAPPKPESVEETIENILKAR